MPLPGSGAISLQDLRNEFGGSGPISITDFYRGGGLVPNDEFCHNNTVPANGNIRLENFYKTTNGNNYRTFTSTTTIDVPENVFRFQADIGGGGSGGVSVRGTGRDCTGGGGFFWAMLGILSGQVGGYVKGNVYFDYEKGDKLTVTVGSGGAGIAQSPFTGGCVGQAIQVVNYGINSGAGGASSIEVRKSNNITSKCSLKTESVLGSTIYSWNIVPDSGWDQRYREGNGKVVATGSYKILKSVMPNTDSFGSSLTFGYAKWGYGTKSNLGGISSPAATPTDADQKQYVGSGGSADAYFAFSGGNQVLRGSGGNGTGGRVRIRF